MAAVAEFSRLIPIEGIVPDKPRAEQIEATPEECAALARRFDLQSVAYFRAKMTILRLSEGKIIRVEGEIDADVTQTCVVSLQGVPTEIKAPFDSYFTEDGKEVFDDEAFSINLEEEEGPDLVVQNGMLDLGELAAQYLALELDPYPRAPGVSLAAQMSETGADTKNRPFQVLKSLKTDDDK